MNWIPVTERLPDGKYTKVLVTSQEGSVYDAFFNGDYFERDDCGGIEVTAWMALPEPYSEPEKKYFVTEVIPSKLDCGPTEYQVRTYSRGPKLIYGGYIEHPTNKKFFFRIVFKSENKSEADAVCKALNEVSLDEVTAWMSLPEPYKKPDRYFVTTKYSNGVSNYEVKDRSQRDRTVFQSNVWKESKSVCMSLNRVQPTAKKSESKPSRYYVSDSFWDGIYSVVDKEKTETLQESNRFGMATRFAAVIPFQSKDKSEADAVCETLNKRHSEKS